MLLEWSNHYFLLTEKSYKKVLQNVIVFNWGGIKPRRTPDKEVIVLAWVTNESISPNLYIEYTTEY